MKEIFSFIADNDYCGIANYVEHYGMTIVWFILPFMIMEYVYEILICQIIIDKIFRVSLINECSMTTVFSQCEYSMRFQIIAF